MSYFVSEPEQGNEQFNLSGQTPRTHQRPERIEITILVVRGSDSTR